MFRRTAHRKQQEKVASKKVLSVCPLRFRYSNYGLRTVTKGALLKALGGYSVINTGNGERAIRAVSKLQVYLHTDKMSKYSFEVTKVRIGHPSNSCSTPERGKKAQSFSLFINYCQVATVSIITHSNIEGHLHPPEGFKLSSACTLSNSCVPGCSEFAAD